MANTKFYICEKCKSIAILINSSVLPLVCGGEEMKELVPGTVEASREKHIPEVKVEGDKVIVTVGSVLHPMAEEHSILWVYLETDRGGQRKNLDVGKEPTVTFALDGEKPVAVYAYCNLHGLWKAEI